MFEKYNLDDMMNAVPAGPMKLKFVMLFALLKDGNKPADELKSDLDNMIEGR